MADHKRQRAVKARQSGADAGASFSESQLLGIALALGSKKVAGWSLPEDRLSRVAIDVSGGIVRDVREQIRGGLDPLGHAFCALRSASERRKLGATFTPATIVRAMIDWAADSGTPARIVDPGVGSARFLLAAAHRFPKATLIGVEIDPLPAILARANVAASGLAKRTTITLGDYREIRLPADGGQTLFIGNPPYVRHHDIEQRWKKWLVETSRGRGHSASQLAGLHVHFFLATLLHASSGDYGAFITAAEWLDVNYGRLLRYLFLSELGGNQIVVIEPKAMPFPDAVSTAAITYFQIGSKPKWINMRRIEHLDSLSDKNGNRGIRREHLATQHRWSRLTLGRNRKRPKSFIELGELCRVHRGQVTGLNKVWIAGEFGEGLPQCVLFPAVTKAHDLFDAGESLNDHSSLRRVIDLPIHLDQFDAADRRCIDKFLTEAKRAGAHAGYVARNRKAWWSIGLHEPAPILATYMARRPPAFVHNNIAARHINIAHGIYPREEFDGIVLINLVSYLRRAVRLREGRTYAGGLTKFEPKEMERLMVPRLEMLSGKTFRKGKGPKGLQGQKDGG